MVGCSGSAALDTDTELQIIRSTTDQVAEVQKLTIKAARVNEVQVISVYFFPLAGGTTAWTDSRADWTGTIKLSYITTECEFCRCPDGDEADENENCSPIEESMYIDPFLADVDDATGPNDATHGYGLRYALTQMENIGDNVAVVVSEDSGHLYFTVEFTGTALLGNVPDLLISSDSIRWEFSDLLMCLSLTLTL